MKAEIISIGDELLLGQVVNSNSAWIGLQFADEGISISRGTTVGDSEEEIISALSESFSRVGLVIMTGGLGPTKDDKTKDVLCKYFNTSLKLHQPALDSVKALFEARNIEITQSNIDQAWLPESCLPLNNPDGTAWGMWLEKEGKICISLPGVPYEMQGIISREVIPRLKERFPEISRNYYRTLLTAGMPESLLAEKIESWENALPENITLAYLPQPGIVRLRLIAGSGTTKSELDEKFNELKGLLPGISWGEGEEQLAEVAGRLLNERGMMLSIAESCTGGYVSHLITSIPGSSAYFTGTVVSYSNELKIKLLGVKAETIEKYGAVSQETVSEMVEGITKLTNSDAAIAISGVAGPGGGSEEKPVGTVWIAVKVGDLLDVRKYSFGPHRGRNIQRSGVMAIHRLIKLLGNYRPD